MHGALQVNNQSYLPPPALQDPLQLNNLPAPAMQVSSRLSHQSRCHNGHGDAQQTHATTSLQLILCMLHCSSAVDSRISLAATMGMGMHSRPMPQHHYSSSYACCTAGQQPELHASTSTAGQQPELHSPTSTAGPTAAQLHASTSTAGQ